jgi:SAM-dependent methyltransferase
VNMPIAPNPSNPSNPSDAAQPMAASPAPRVSPAKAEQTAKARARIAKAKEWLRRTSDFVDLQLSLIRASLRRVAPRARGRLLDVGCGDKPFESIFRPFVTEYVGVEHRETFELTKASGPELGGSKRPGPDVLYSGDRMPFPDRSFDTVLSVQVLEHTPQPGLLVREMARVLADDGILILMAPFQFRLHEQPHDYFRYSPHGLRQLCAEAGLEVTHVEQQGSLWSLLGHKLNSYLALRVALMGAMAQRMGKLGHEKATLERPRYWTLPVVGPSMLGIAVGARLLDRVAFDPEETLGFLIIARHAPKNSMPKQNGPS